MRKRLLETLLCCLCMAHAARAQHTEDGDTLGAATQQLEGVTVSETLRQRTLRSTTPQHVLGRGDWLRMGIADMASALHRLPGITLRDYGGAGGMKTVSVRGFGPQHTGVSYDGLLLSDCQNGQTDLARYSLESVEELALVVGDNDDIFLPARNAGAVATLNIRSWAPTHRDDAADGQTPARLTAQLRAGSFGYVAPSLRAETWLAPRVAVAATGEYVYAENDYPFTLRNVSVTTRERRTNSRMNQGHAELNMLWLTGAAGRLEGKLYYYDNDRQLPGQVRYYTDLSLETLRDRNAFGQLRYTQHWGGRWALSCSGKVNWSSSSYRDGLYSGQVRDADYWQREYYTTACLLFEPDGTWAFSYAADYALNNLNSSLDTDTRPYRHTVVQAATAKLRQGRLTVLGRLLHTACLNGARRGEGARNVGRLSPSVSLSYRLLPGRNVFLRASYKNIFRSPTFNESYFYHYGSTDLLPESTDQLNLGLTWSMASAGQEGAAGAWEAELTVDGYANHVRDKIVAVPYNMFIWRCINVGKVRTLGTDMTARLSWQAARGHRLSAAANYSLQHVRNRTMAESPYYGLQLAYMPEHVGACSLSWENPWASLTLHGNGISSRWTTNEHYEGTRVAGFFELGLTAWHTFRTARSNDGRRSLQVRMDLKNLLDHQYEIVRLYPMPGFSYQLSLIYKF